MIEMADLIAFSPLFIVVVAAGARYLSLARRYHWPNGERRTMTHHGYTVHVITQGEAASEELQAACTQAVASAAHAWILSGKRGARGKIGEVAVCFVSDHEFDAHQVVPLRRAAAYLEGVPRGMGRHMPCAMIRTSLKDHVLGSGDPVIHEMLCVLDGCEYAWPPDTWELSDAVRPLQKFALQAYENAGAWYIQ